MSDMILIRKLIPNARSIIELKALNDARLLKYFKAHRQTPRRANEVISDIDFREHTAQDEVDHNALAKYFSDIKTELDSRAHVQ